MNSISLSDICNSITDCPHSTPLWTDSGKIVVRNQNIKNGRLDLSNPSYTNEENYKNRCRRAKPEAGDIIITREAPMGEVCMVPKGLECCLGQRMVLLKVDSLVCDSKYLLYALMSKHVQSQILWSEGTGTTVSNLRIPHLEKLQIPVIPLSRQRDIASVLSTLDRKIENNNAINQRLEQMVQAIFKSWFVDFEPFTDGEFLASELGDIPTGWRVGLLAELIKVKYGKDHKRLAEGSIPVFGSGGMMRYCEKALYNKESVLIPRKGTLNNIIYMNEPFWTVDTMFYSEMLKPNLAKFIYFFLKSKDLVSMNAGSAVPSMTTDILNHIQVVIPPDEVLQQYNSIVTPQFEVIQKNNEQSLTLANIREILLPKLMSGEIEVPHASQI